MNRNSLVTAILWWVAGVAAFSAGTLRAGDWPQVLGPARNGHAVGESLPETWPPGGFANRWTREIGSGYAGPAVVGQTVVVFHRRGGVERVEALNVNNGERQWSVDFPARYRGGVNPDIGPRAVPLVHDGRVYVFGAAGDLHCVQLSDGRKVWSRSTYQDFDGDEGYFGAGSSPIASGLHVIVNVGGRDGAGLVAFDLATGKTAWKATDARASYSSPTWIEFNGKQHVLFVTRYKALAVDPDNGAIQFQFPFGKRGPTVNAATPLVFDNRLFVTASYGVGARTARLTDGSPQTLWSGDQIMSSQYATPVFYDGHLYGIHGREDIGRAQLRCVDAETGRVRWTEDDFGVAHLILAGQRLLVLSVEGELMMAEPKPDGFRKLGAMQVSEHTTRALPALAGGSLLVRDTNGDRGRLICLRIDRRE